MILTGPEIRNQVAAGRIIIDPFEPSLVNPNSYNYRLGEYIKPMNGELADPVGVDEVPAERIPVSGMVLMPGRLYLGHTFERIGSFDYVTSLIGRSSVGRLGMFLQLSADLGHQGAVHAWTLELTVIQPLRIYPGMEVGQVTFWIPAGEPSYYEGIYSEQDSPYEYHGHLRDQK